MRRNTSAFAALTRIPIIAILVAGIGAIHVVPVTVASNPPAYPENSIEANVQVPETVERVINNACRNCHSNQTKWPWYARAAPLSWLVVRDVESAWRAMNFSEWSAQAGRTPYKTMGVLMTACVDLESGHMPPSKYRLVHPEARLTAEEVNTYCAWSKEVARQLRGRNAGVKKVEVPALDY